MDEGWRERACTKNQPHDQLAPSSRLSSLILIYVSFFHGILEFTGRISVQAPTHRCVTRTFTTYLSARMLRRGEGVEGGVEGVAAPDQAKQPL